MHAFNNCKHAEVFPFEQQGGLFQKFFSGFSQIKIQVGILGNAGVN